MSNTRSALAGGVYFLLFSLFFFLFMYVTMRLEGGDRPFDVGNGKIAVVRIEGIILDARKTTELLRRYQDDGQVKAVLLRIDSPGGGVAASQEIHDAVRRLQSVGKKIVVTSMGTVAASGGYYIASPSDKIISNPGTLTGSIGVIMQMVNAERLFKIIGVEGITVKSGQNKDIGSPFRKMTEEEHRLLQGVLDDVHDQFIEAVAEGRGLSLDEVRRLADGRLFSGRQAKANGLVDDLGTLEDAIRVTARLAGIQGEPEIVESEDPLNLLEWIGNRLRLFTPSPTPSVQLNYLLSF